MSEKIQEENESGNKQEVNDSEKKQEEHEVKVETRPGEWMVKPCDWYIDEYKDCTCMRSRFNQYFVYGEYLDCSQWKIDHKNCLTWKSSDDTEAFDALIASEKKRRMERLGPHFRNDVWTKRDKPPENWNEPLPEWLERQQRGTFLYYKQRALESGTVNDIDTKIPNCTIL